MSQPINDPRAPMEAWLRQLEDWAERDRSEGAFVGEKVCRWCAVGRGFHYATCPVNALLEGVRTYTAALRRSGLMESPPMSALAVPPAPPTGPLDDLPPSLRTSVELFRENPDEWHAEQRRIHDFKVKLIDQSRSAAPPTGWQDIASAPKDGSDVLLFFPKADSLPQSGGVHRAAWSGDRWYMVGHHCGGELTTHWYQPTHWMEMPLPPAPLAANGQQET